MQPLAVTGSLSKSEHTLIIMHSDNSFQALAEVCLFQPAIEAKLAATRAAGLALSSGKLVIAPVTDPQPATRVRFPDAPVLVEPRQLPRRSLTQAAGRVAFLHAVAHIEFTAILLAWDMAYRFPGLPDTFYRDWVGVACEEARHFEAVRSRLRSLGADYGDLPAHRGLWELAEQTSDDVLHRLAMVPRFMEARGLDVTPAMIDKLKAVDDTESVAVLELILREEVGHVALGSRWFDEVARRRGLEPEATYFDLIARYLHGEVRGPFNRSARLQAGFSESELQRLETLSDIR